MNCYSFAEPRQLFELLLNCQEALLERHND